MDLSSVSSKNIPKMSAPTLEIKNNYYVVKVGLLYNYYPIKIKAGQPEDSIMRFEKTPPVLMEGVAIVNKQAYHVTVKDLQRQVIRKSRVVEVAKREKVNGKAGNSTQEDSTKSVYSAIQNSNKSGAVSETELEISKAADAAWEEQIGTLLDSFSSQEGDEWEVSDSA